MAKKFNTTLFPSCYVVVGDLAHELPVTSVNKAVEKIIRAAIRFRKADYDMSEGGEEKFTRASDKLQVAALDLARTLEKLHIDLEHN